jgi:hypothetical protein
VPELEPVPDAALQLESESELVVPSVLLELVLVVPVALVLWLWDSMVDKADSGMVSPLFVTELIVI